MKRYLNNEYTSLAILILVWLILLCINRFYGVKFVVVGTRIRKEHINKTSNAEKEKTIPFRTHVDL